MKDGAAFYADVVKTVLGAHFGPGFDKGWDLAKKIGDKVADLDKAAHDPAGYARDWALGELGDRADVIEGRIKDRLKDVILGNLLDAGVADSDADKLAGEILLRFEQRAMPDHEDERARLQDHESARCISRDASGRSDVHAHEPRTARRLLFPSKSVLCD